MRYDAIITQFYKTSGGSRGDLGVHLNYLPAAVWSLSETKLFHFHGIFKKNEIELAKRAPLCFGVLRGIKSESRK